MKTLNDSASSIVPFDKMSKQQLKDLARLYAYMISTIDGLWFLEVEKASNLEEAVRIDEKVWRIGGGYEGKRIGAFLGIKNPCSIDDVVMALKLSPLIVRNSPEIETNNGKCILSFKHCAPQQARVRKGFGEFPCKEVTMAWLEGFASELEPNIESRCVFCPPDKHPDNIWCSWELSINRD